MRTRVGCLVFCLSLSALGLAQSAPRPRNSVRERVIDSSSERMRWEAAQTWNSPLVPTATEAVHPAIHLEQPPLTPPRIRREWLRPSPEAATPDANSNVADILGNSSYVPKKAQ